MNWIRWENASLGPTGDHVFFNEFGKTQHITQRSGDKHARTTSDESDGMRRRVRAAPSSFFFLRRRLGSYHSLGGGRRKMPFAEQRRRCSYPSLERIILGISLGSRAVWDIRGGSRHSCSVDVCHELRISASTSACTSTCHQ